MSFENMEMVADFMVLYSWVKSILTTFQKHSLFNVLHAKKLCMTEIKSLRKVITKVTNVINGARPHLYYLLMTNFIAQGQKKGKSSSAHSLD